MKTDEERKKKKKLETNRRQKTENKGEREEEESVTFISEFQFENNCVFLKKEPFMDN